MQTFYDETAAYNRHYITTRPDGAITGAWSDGPHPKKDTTDAICINEQGGYQFRLILNGEQAEENPPIYTMDGIPLYKWDGEQVVRRTEEEIEADRAAVHPLDELRAVKKEEIGAACTAAIYAGVSVGESHYSLTEHDQMELTAQYTLVKEGAPAVPYHADGELCRMYPADEFTALARAATAHVFYHRTYCNHVNAWIARAQAEELDGIVYGAQLPEDLAASMAAILEAGGGAESAV